MEFKEQDIYLNEKFELSFQSGQLLKIGARLNCQLLGDELFLRNSCELFVLFGMVLFLFKL